VTKLLQCRAIGAYWRFVTSNSLIPHGICFGTFELDVAAGELRKAGIPVKLQPQPFRLLLLLAERAGTVVTREEIQQCLWSESTFVDFEHGINFSINQIRGALADDAEKPRYIETLPRRGYRFIANVERQHESVKPKPGVQPAAAHSWRFVLAVGLPTILLVVSYLAWHRIHPRPPVPVARIMMAVLPFQNLTGDPKQEYLADGVTEEMITQLGRLQPERLGVIARTSVMGYKHGDQRIDQIGRELGVQYVLEGSVRRDENHLRITAQLIQVKDQSHVWAREYDRSSKDVFALQDDVATAVTEEIQSRLALAPQNRSVRNRPIVNPEAYDAYLLGRYSLSRRTAAGLQKAERYFHVAIAAEPNYALAYAGLADSYLLMAANGTSLQAVSLQARTAANKALAIDPTLGEPHAILALIAQNHDWNWAESEREYKLAMALDPNDATPHQWYASDLAVRGRFEESLREIAIARQLDPLSLLIMTVEGESLYLARRYDDAIGKLDQALQIEPNFSPARVDRGLSSEQKGMWREAIADLETARRLDNSPRSTAMLGEAFALSGDKPRARQILAELQDRAKREYVSPLYQAIVYAGLGEKDAAFSGLQAAFEERATDMLGLKTGALYDPLRSDPRFDDLLKRMGLAQ
jgi:TolB-like protein/DNA-binding winged helix-turn-helix (wHTH) protein/Flp pilus assembly protein TadD